MDVLDVRRCRHGLSLSPLSVPRPTLLALSVARSGRSDGALQIQSLPFVCRASPSSC